jgi:methyl-accepting chemotaxis protein
MLNNLKLRNRILAGYAFPIAISTIATGIIFATSSDAKKEVELLLTHSFMMKNTLDADVSLQNMVNSSHFYMFNKDKAAKKSFEDDKQRFREAIEALQKLEGELNEEHENDKAALEAVIKNGENLQNYYNRIVAMVDAGKVSDAIKLEQQGEGMKLVLALEDTVKNAESAIQEDLELFSSNASKDLSVLLFVVISCAIIVAVCSILFALLISGQINNILSQAINSVTSVATQIATTVLEQERIISQQASSVNETTTTVEQMGSSSRQTAEQAEASASGAKQALALSENGSHAVQQTMEGMSILKEQVRAIAEQIMQLSEQTGHIAGISDLVSDLANQTNMLALNAAVEAARAGDSGKGFAVVAGEIRKLADESKKSAEKINTLISDVQSSMNSSVMVTDEGTKKADLCIQLAQGTAETFMSVADAVNSVYLNSQQISLSSKQQVVGIQQIVAAMSAINLGAQETTTGITQVKVSTQNLKESATKLQEVI